MSFWTISFLVANLALVASIVALPLGKRRISQRRILEASAERIWQALYPLGRDAGFDGELVGVRQIDADSAWLAYSWRGRDDRPIERLTAFDDVKSGLHFTARVVDDTSLDQSFWKDFRETISLRAAEGRAEATEVTISQVDSYRGAAFLIFRYFALRRRLSRLRDWAETGEIKKQGLMFEHPLSQVGFATLSALLIWPFFGLTVAGLSAAVALTLVIALHELGHVVAFRIVGHRSARMIFIPLLGGIAIGGRPYDKKFEVAFVALMGPGFSAFLVTACMSLAYLLKAYGHSGFAIIAVTVAGLVALFNLANLLPVWRFDGAQVLRQLTGHWQLRAVDELFLLAPFILVAWLLGSPLGMLAGFAAATLAIAVVTRNAVFTPRKPLTPMSRVETLAACAGLAAVVSVHAMGVVWAGRLLFPNAF